MHCFSISTNSSLLQRKYIVKFATDGAVLTKTKNAVQGTMKLIPCDEHWKVSIESNAYKKLDKEITLYYYIGEEFKVLLFCFHAWKILKDP